MAQIAVVGNLARDRVDGGPPQPGGCPFFAAYALRAIGRPGQILTRCADADREGSSKPLREPRSTGQIPPREAHRFELAHAGEPAGRP